MSSTNNNAEDLKEPIPRSLFSYLPNIYVLRPPQGKSSRKTDERCLIYCSQTVVGRTTGREPWCRSICLRKVFFHEVHKSTLTADRKIVHNKNPIHLPREGQTPTGFFFSNWDDNDDDDEERGRKPRAREDPRVWDQGWYFWYSRDPWAAREKINGMKLSLETQAYWEDIRNQHNRESRPTPPPGLNTVGSGLSRNTLPYPDLIGETLLIPVEYPSLEPVTRMLRNLLTPTGKVLNILSENVKSGAIIELSGRLWEKAKGPEPWILARNSIDRAWELLKNIRDDEDEDDKPKGL